MVSWCIDQFPHQIASYGTGIQCSFLSLCPPHLAMERAFNAVSSHYAPHTLLWNGHSMQFPLTMPPTRTDTTNTAHSHVPRPRTTAGLVTRLLSATVRHVQTRRRTGNYTDNVLLLSLHVLRAPVCLHHCLFYLLVFLPTQVWSTIEQPEWSCKIDHGHF